MIASKTIALQNKTGLHARPATDFVQLTKKFSSDVYILKEEKRIDAKSIMGILSLALKNGDTFVIEAEGEDAEKTIEALDQFFMNLQE